MHRIAEYGIAAHALYKDEIKPPAKSNGKGNGKGNGSAGVLAGGFSAEVKAYEWLRRTIAMLAEGDTPEEFLEHTKLELFQDQVFCFTPKGRLIALPRGATPIDFAYAVHTELGDTCVGCRINGRPMPLTSELRNGDEVYIDSVENQMPQPAWENVVVTGKARSAIRRAARTAIRKQYAGIGREMLERAFRAAKRSFDDEALVEALPRLAQTDLDDMLAAVGRGEVPPVNVVKAVYPDDAVAAKNAVKPGRPAKGRGGKAKASAIPIRGIEGDIAVRFAPGGAVPGDRIVGIMTAGEGVTIYPIQSPALKEFDDEPDRWIDMRWDVEPDSDSRFPARILVVARNEPGTLAEVAQIIGDSQANISNIAITRSAQDFSDIVIDLEVADLKHLTRLLAELRGRGVVSVADRVDS
jgi:(p)ppGpp synthase/HD superfamily hydrolase